MPVSPIIYAVLAVFISMNFSSAMANQAKDEAPKVLLVYSSGEPTDWQNLLENPTVLDAITSPTPIKRNVHKLALHIRDYLEKKQEEKEDILEEKKRISEEIVRAREEIKKEMEKDKELLERAEEVVEKTRRILEEVQLPIQKEEEKDQGIEGDIKEGEEKEEGPNQEKEE